MKLQGQEFKWVQTTGSAVANKIVPDEKGYLLITGSFTGTVDFDPGDEVNELISYGSSDIFVAKYDTSGNYQWAVNFGGPDADEGWDIAVDTAYIYITGSFSGEANFSTEESYMVNSNGGTDIFVAKLTNEQINTTEWVYTYGGSGNDKGTIISIDSYGDICFGGHFRDTMKVGENQVPLYSPNTTGFFLIKSQEDFLTPSLILYDNNYHGTSEIVGIDFDYYNNILIIGNFTDTLDLGKEKLVSKGENDIFIAQANSSVTWNQRVGGLMDDEPVGISGSYDFSISGNFQGTIDVGTDTLTSKGKKDFFVANLDNSGDYLWVNQYGGAGDDMANVISMTHSEIFLGCQSNTNFHVMMGNEKFEFTNQGGLDAYVLKVDQYDGLNKRIFPIQGTGDDEIKDFAFFEFKETVYSLGSFQSTTDFDPGLGEVQETASAGMTDFFVAAHDIPSFYIDYDYETLCPLVPYPLITNRKETPGTTYSWKFTDSYMYPPEWKDIPNNSYYKNLGDTLIIKPLPTHEENSFSYLCIRKDLFGIDSSEVSTYVYSLTEFNISKDTIILPGQQVTIEADAGFSSYLWNTGDTTRIITTDSAGFYIATVIDQNNCPVSDTMAVDVTFLVTVDTVTNKIMLVWGRPSSTDDQLLIYKKVDGKNILVKTSSFSEQNQFFDTDSDPDNESYLYTFVLKKNTGDSIIVAVHQSILLNAISDKTNNTTTLTWNPYIGLSYDTFYVYRGPSEDQLELIDKIPYEPGATQYQYIDNYHPELMYYRVEVITEVSLLVDKKSNNGPFSRSLSNLEDNRHQATTRQISLPLEDTRELLVYPNPSTGSATVIFENDLQEKYSLRLYDISGKPALSIHNITGNQIQIQGDHLEPGYYIIELAGKKVFREKLIIE